MQIPECCRLCKYCEEIPFAGFTCFCEQSDYYHCDCDPFEDLCRDFKEKKE